MFAVPEIILTGTGRDRKVTKISTFELGWLILMEVFPTFKGDVLNMKENSCKLQERRYGGKGKRRVQYVYLRRITKSQKNQNY